MNFHDITERKKLEQLKDEFIGIASHELKTPLTALKGYIHVLLQLYGEREEQLNTTLKKMDNQMNRLTHIINDMLDVSRIQEKKIELRKEIFIIGSLVKEVVEDMQHLTKKHQIKIKESSEEKNFADKYRITQVLMNLLSNAIKYSPESSQIVVRCWKKNDTIYISIKDFGIGISKKEYTKIFQRFYQEGSPNKKISGLGLGLYISLIFIKEHGGKIWVRSKESKGSLFTFSLPIGKS